MEQHYYVVVGSELLRGLVLVFLGKLLSYSECQGFEYYTHCCVGALLAFQ